MASVDGPARARLTVFEAEPGRLLLQLAGELDITTVDPLQEQVDALIGRGVEVVGLDLAPLEFMDSSGIALLLSVTSRFGPLEVRGANDLIRRTVEALGLGGVLRVGEHQV